MKQKKRGIQTLMISKRFLIYFGRWQVSTLVMAPIMWLIGKVIGTSEEFLLLNLFLTQSAGSCIFYYIDKRIFK